MTTPGSRSPSLAPDVGHVASSVIFAQPPVERELANGRTSAGPSWYCWTSGASPNCLGSCLCGIACSVTLPASRADRVHMFWWKEVPISWRGSVACLHDTRASPSP
jgi:hypothetical protein